MENITWDNLQKEMDEYFKTPVMYGFIDDGLPVGSQFDPNAPWNEDEEELDEFDYLEFEHEEE